MNRSPATYPRVQEMHIGNPIRYVEGPFAGRTIRAELSECQKPDLGRKFAKRDRRPVDPPPVVRIRLFETKDEGTPNETEEELHADAIDISGLVAHVDLFPLHPLEELRHTEDSLSSAAGSSLTPKGGIKISEERQVHRSDDRTIEVDENAKLTSAIFGSSFVHAVQVLDTSGEQVILFVFADLSVRLEGHFVCRYRSFDLLGRVSGSKDAVPITAELFSGVFVIYSTKEFPGLQASTLLTKHLGRWGVRVNLRETSRKKKGKQSGEDDDDEGSSGAGDTVPDDERENQFYTSNFLAPYTTQVDSLSGLAPVTFGAPLSYADQFGYVEHSQGQPQALDHEAGVGK